MRRVGIRGFRGARNRRGRGLKESPYSVRDADNRLDRIQDGLADGRAGLCSRGRERVGEYARLAHLAELRDRRKLANADCQHLGAVRVEGARGRAQRELTHVTNYRSGGVDGVPGAVEERRRRQRRRIERRHRFNGGQRGGGQARRAKDQAKREQSM